MSTKMSDDRLNALKDIATPAPSEDARRRALDAALLAFDEAQAKKASHGSQAPGGGERLRSVVQNLRGNWIMDTRISIGLGTAAVALLLLPLGYQLVTSTSMTPINADPPIAPMSTVEPAESADEEAAAAASAPAPEPMSTTTGRLARDNALLAEGDGNVVQQEQAAGLAGGELRKDLGTAADAAGTRSAAPPIVAAESMAPGYAMPLADSTSVRLADPSGNEFTDFDESPVKVTAEEPVSTFSIDIDTASYAYVRRMLNDGFMPEADAVRIEEMINYFDYNYPTPQTADAPFRATIEIYPTPWNPETQLVQIGIKGFVPPAAEDVASNLTFLIDTSGSMDSPDRLPLVKRSLAMFVDQLTANDTVSIVVYAGAAGVVLEPTSATEKAKILAAIDNLHAGGSTAGGEGIELAYRLAEQNRIEGGVNRVILATDGDFNVGISDPDQLIDFIKQKREGGVFLSVLGYGTGNYQDDTMQALAQNGNGNAAYIDSFKEARKVLVEEMGGTLMTIAQDVKIQVEFNPAVVSEYRLVGYETRTLRREDFNNDRVDAGDIGAGHTVTALYEITPVGSGAILVDPLRYGSSTPAAAATASDEIGFLKLRYKLPGGTTSALIESPITKELAVDSLAGASDDARWAAAVAAFAQKLRGSSYGQEMTYEQIRALAQGARGSDEDGHRAEFMQLINAARSVDGEE
jgi:Ca-activated chloride channel homolog